MRRLLWLGFLWLGCAQAFQHSLEEVRLERNPEKRSERALDYANVVLDRARQAYEAGDEEKFQAALKEILAAVELSFDSLKASGKNARRNPKYFKRADTKLRALIKRLQTLETDVDLERRPAVDIVEKRLSQIQEQVVLAILSNG
jgi:hypothetical protein